MADELQPGVRGEVNAVLLIVWSRKTGQQMKIGRTIGNQGLREQGQNFGQAIAVPCWAGPVHRRRDKVVAIWIVQAGTDDLGPEVLEDGIDTLAHCDGAVGAGEEVGQARDDADVGFWPHLLQALLKDPGVAASNYLEIKQRIILAS